jgi:hypothetical protein
MCTAFFPVSGHCHLQAIPMGAYRDAIILFRQL